MPKDLMTHIWDLIRACVNQHGGSQRQFDDTIEHEAWNDSDELGVIFIFDTWHPNLRPEEQRLTTALNSALNAFSAESPSGYGA